MKRLPILLSYVLLMLTASHAQTKTSVDRMTEAELLGFPSDAKTVIEKQFYIFEKNGVKSEEQRRFVKVMDFNTHGQNIWERQYGSAIMDGSVHFGDTKVFFRESLAELENVDEKSLPPVESYPVRKDLTARSMPQSRFVYDEKNNIVEFWRYRIDGSLISKSTYLYDNQRRRVEWKLFGPLDGPKTTTYRYNEDGSLLEWKQAGYQATTTITYSSYKFDDHGNWIERIESNTFEWHVEGLKNRPPSPARETKVRRIIIYHK